MTETEDHEWYAEYRREVEAMHWIKSELDAGRAIETTMIYGGGRPLTGMLKLDLKPIGHPDCPVKLTFS
jgi:hypothetical protein